MAHTDRLVRRKPRWHWYSTYYTLQYYKSWGDPTFGWFFAIYYKKEPWHTGFFIRLFGFNLYGNKY